MELIHRSQAKSESTPVLKGKNMQSQEHKGRVAIITGGGRGFGKAFGHALASRGAHVVQVDIDAEVGEQAAAEIRKAGGSASAFAADVNDDERISQLITSSSITPVCTRLNLRCQWQLPVSRDYGDYLTQM